MMRNTAVLFLACTAVLRAADADLILHHGKFVTADAKFSIAAAVAIRDGRIVAAGPQAEVMKQRGPRTRLMDLEGRTVLPGLIDAHVHALEAALSEYRHPLPAFDSYAAVRRYIREQARTAAPDAWIIVPRTFPTRLKELRMPTRDTLDVTSHPVLFDASYVLIVNTAGLKALGITRNTPNPPGGEIVKDPSGEPNGILKNPGPLVRGVRTPDSFTDEEKLSALEQMLRRYAAAGLTAVGDRAVTLETIALFRRLRTSGRLPVRTVLTWRIDASQSIDRLLAEIRDFPFPAGSGDDWLRFGTFKVTLDGGMTIGTAFQRYPYGAFGKQLYGKTNPDDRGQLFVAPEKLTQIMRAARNRGWQLTTHDQGGGAIDVFLDTLEALDRERPIAPSRSHLMHASFQSPEAIARMKKMGILADAQAQWLYFDGPALERVFGYDGLRYFYPLRSYRNAGIPIAAGSDHMIGHDKNRAVNPYNPFLGMWMEVARRTVEGKVLHPEERLTREEALRTYTTWAAYLQFAEKDRGSLEPGKLADLVVIDRDFLTCPEDEIKDIEPVMTMIGGKVVHRR